MLSTNDNQASVAEAAVDEHEGQFYCGLCGWVAIGDYDSHGHAKKEESA